MILLPCADYLHIKYKKLSDVLIDEENCLLSYLIGSVSIILKQGCVVKTSVFKAFAAPAATIHIAAACGELC